MLPARYAMGKNHRGSIFRYLATRQREVPVKCARRDLDIGLDASRFAPLRPPVQRRCDPRAPRTASFSIRSVASKTMCVVPSRHGCRSRYEICPSGKLAERLLAIGGRGTQLNNIESFLINGVVGCVQMEAS